MKIISFVPMVKVLLVTSILLFCDESFAQQTLAGHYIISPRTIFQKTFGPLSDYKYHIVGSELTLNKDSSFEYRTCGNFMRGTWTSNTDSVFLNISHNEYRTDSMRRTGEKPAIPKRPLSFKIKDRTSDKVFLYRVYEKTIELLRRKEI